jgi:predicted MFS family arabinose efflux permease
MLGMYNNLSTSGGHVNPLRSVAVAPNALYLLGTSLVGRLPSAMSALAIVQLVRLQDGDFALAGIMTSAYIVAGAAGQPVLGRLIDRTRQTVVLLVAAVASTLAFVAMAVTVTDLPVVGIAAAAVAGLFTPPLEPSLRTLWPRLVPEGPVLKAAFSLDAGAQEILFIVGPLLTVVGIGAFGATGNIVFAAALGLAGTLAFAANPASRAVRAIVLTATDAPRRSPLRVPQFRRIVFFALGAGVPVGALTIVVTVYEEQHGVIGFSGWALSANALGALIGATTLALRPLKSPPQALLAVCGLLLALVYVPLAFADLPPVLYLVAAVLSGLLFPPTLAQIFESTEQLSARTGLTEANAWIVSALNVGIALGILGAGAFAETTPLLAVPATVVASIAVTALLSLLVLPSRMRRSDPDTIPWRQPEHVPPTG